MTEYNELAAVSPILIPQENQKYFDSADYQMARQGLKVLDPANIREPIQDPQELPGEVK